MGARVGSRQVKIWLRGKEGSSVVTTWDTNIKSLTLEGWNAEWVLSNLAISMLTELLTWMIGSGRFSPPKGKHFLSIAPWTLTGDLRWPPFVH